VIPKDTTGAVEAIRQLQAARHSALKARSATLCQLGELLTTAPAVVSETVTACQGTANLSCGVRRIISVVPGLSG
jgi:hypothetical protein